jgi:hypothetical protein
MVTAAQTGAVLRKLRKSLLVRDGGGMTDGQLLESHFIEGERVGSQTAAS